MAELTKGSGLLVLVDKEYHNFGEVYEDAVIEYAFQWLGEPEQIEYIEKGCGCTSAFYDHKTKQIRGDLDLAKANGSREYPIGETAVDKYIFVWLNDGQPRFIADPLKQKQQNPAKAWFRLSLKGKVVK